MVATDTASYSDQVVGLFTLLGYRFSPGFSTEVVAVGVAIGAGGFRFLRPGAISKGQGRSTLGQFAKLARA